VSPGRRAEMARRKLPPCDEVRMDAFMVPLYGSNGGRTPGSHPPMAHMHEGRWTNNRLVPLGRPATSPSSSEGLFAPSSELVMGQATVGHVGKAKILGKVSPMSWSTPKAMSFRPFSRSTLSPSRQPPQLPSWHDQLPQAQLTEIVRPRWAPHKLEQLIKDKIQERTCGYPSFSAFKLFAKGRGSTEITFNDFRHTIGRLLNAELTEAEARMLFDKYDEDGGGTIDTSEFVNGIMPPASKFGPPPTTPHVGKF